MAKYLIGMHNVFDELKYDRNYRKEFSGIEFCNLDSQQLNKILRLKKEKGFEIGIHFPLYREDYPRRDPLIFSKNQGESRLALHVLEKEMAYADEINASYLLIHLPKPMIINSSLNWGKYKFADYEYIDEKEYSYEIFEQQCHELFRWLDEKQQKYNIDIILEIEIINRYLYKGKLLNGHYPAIEGLKVQEEWGDIKNMLELISSKNKDLKILFEHRSDLISDTELQQCYEWISSYFNEDSSIVQSI